MLGKIIRVEPTTPMLSVTWMTGSRCNYNCMYCPSNLHDDTSKHPDLEELKTAWKNIYNKTKEFNLPYKISFTGGEVTANKNFLPLVEYIRSNDFNIGQLVVTTNGSASLRYYLQLAEIVDALSFSTHSEFFNEKDFFNKAIKINQVMVQPKKIFHVNVMDERWNQERIKLYIKWLTKHKISHSLNAIDYNFITREMPLLNGVYNIEQI